jgi:hypothetical protein
MAVSLAKSSIPQGVVVPVAMHSITVRHGAGGRAVTSIVGLDSLNVYTRATTRRINGKVVGPGLTVRTDYTETFRFEGNVEVVDHS